jgi:hypothetical protein
LCSTRIRLVISLFHPSITTDCQIDSHVAEHRGPGVHHGFDDSREDLDMPMDIDHRSGGLGGRLGRGIILLGDGSGSFGIQDSNEHDADMFDNYEEDQDLESQVNKGTPSGSEDEGEAAEERSRREETPAPQTSSTDTLPSKTHSDASTIAAKPIEESDAKKVDAVTPATVAP